MVKDGKRKHLGRLVRLAAAILVAGAVGLAVWVILATDAANVHAGRPVADSQAITHGAERNGAGWTRRVKLIFSNTAQTDDLVDFPVLVMLNSARIDYGQTQDAGQDVRFVDADDTTALPHEIERWDEGGTSFVWVKVPEISGSSNSDYIWMYYGNPDAPDGQDPTGVWTSDFRMVYHLEENPTETGGTFRDSTGHGFTATNQGSIDAAGFIANAQEFPGTYEYVNLGADLAVLNAITATTLSAWIRPDSVGGNGDLMGLARNNGGAPTGNSRASIIHRGSNVGVYARSRDDDNDFNEIETRNEPIASGDWRYVVAVVNYVDDAVVIYINGVPATLSGPASFDNAVTPDTNSASGAIGSNDDGSGPFFDGVIDEARVAATARSADWVAAQYASMTGAFVAFGEQEEVGVPVLSLEARASRGEVYAGSRLDYVLMVENTGARATNLVVSDTLPANTAFGGCGCTFAGWTSNLRSVPLSPNSCGASLSCGLEAGQVVWRMDGMDGGLAYQMTFWVTVDGGMSEGTLIVNDDYAVAADGQEPRVITRPVTTTVRNLLVSISNVGRPDPVQVGEQLQYTLTVRNDGAALQDVTVTDVMPNGVFFMDCEGALCGLTDDSEPTVRWWLDSLPGGSATQLGLSVLVHDADLEAVVNEVYGAWVPAAQRNVMGAPTAVRVSGLVSYPHHIHLPALFSGWAK